MWTRMQDLPPEVSTGGLREAQQVLDRDLRAAIENNRADRRPGRGLPGGVPPLTNTKIRKARDTTAVLVNDHLRAGRFGRLRIAWNWLRRLFRRNEVSESARKPRLTTEQVGNWGQVPQAGATSGHEPGPSSGESTRDGRQPATADQGGNRGQAPPAGATSGHEPGPSSGEPARESRRPITAEQVESWKRTLKEEGLREHERHGLEMAIAAAYLVSSNRDLQKLYEDPRQLQDIADAFALADWAAERYDNGPRAAQPSPVYADEQQAMPPTGWGGYAAPTWADTDEQSPAPWEAHASPSPVYADEQQEAMSPTAWGGHTTPAAYADEQQAVPPSAATARDTRSEWTPQGDPHAASLTSLRPVPNRSTGSPAQRPAPPNFSRPTKAAGQRMGRG